MLDLITKSKTRQNILRLLFANPKNEFYLSEIAKKTKASVGNCQRELSKMVKLGILKSDRKTNLIFYSVNRQSPIFDEFSKIISKTIGLDEELRNLIKKFPGIKFALIFGSYLRKDFSANSDIDLFLVGKINETVLIKEIRLLESAVGREINYHLYSEEDFKSKLKVNSFLQNIVKNYLFLTDNQNEFEKLLRKFSR